MRTVSIPSLRCFISIQLFCVTVKAMYKAIAADRACRLQLDYPFTKTSQERDEF